MEQEAREPSYSQLVAAAEEHVRSMNYSEAAKGFLMASEHAGMLKHRIHIQQAKFFQKLAGESVADAQSRIDNVRTSTESDAPLDTIMGKAFVEYGTWLRDLYDDIDDTAFKQEVFDEAAGAFTSAAAIYDLHKLQERAEEARLANAAFVTYVKGATT